MVAIFVALMFIGLVLIDLLVQRLEARRARTGEFAWNLARGDERPLSLAQRQAAPAPWSVPEGVHVSEGHAWFRSEGQSELLTGADALVGQVLGTASSVIPPEVGSQVKAGRPLFQVKVNGRVMALASPVTGTVVAVNRRLKECPGLVADEPYGEGWVCAILPTLPELKEGAAEWQSGTRAAAWLELEFDRLRKFVLGQIAPDPALGLTSPDGGLPARGCLTQFDGSVWSAFEREFLRLR